MAFRPITTERLVLRAPLLSDVEASVERRNLPEVAKYQDWELPYERERAEQSFAKLVEMDGPADGQGWSVTVIDREDPTTILGDVYVGITWGGRTAEVGYTFHPDHWGMGYATEATEAIIRWLFDDFGVLRVEASLHPDNPASARVVEACGLLFEGLTRGSFWVGNEISDDMLYGMTKADWEAWTTRPRHRPEVVELAPVTEENLRAVLKLATHKSQEAFVSPMLGNFAQALAPPSVDGERLIPWYRVVLADGDVVGFIMAAAPTPDHPDPYLWRFLIDRLNQRRGIGSMALDRFEQWARGQGAGAVEVSWGEGPGSPAAMYLARGYVPTGKLDGDEIHAAKPLN